MGATNVWYGVINGKESRQEPELRVADHPFFRGIDPELIDAAAEGSVGATYETGDLLVREGRLADHFHLIFQGKVAVEVVGSDGLRQTVQTIGPGEVLCWSWISPPYVCRFDARALKRTRVVSLDASVVRNVLESRPAEGFRFLQRLVPVIGQRLENTRVQLLEAQGI